MQIYKYILILHFWVISKTIASIPIRGIGPPCNDLKYIRGSNCTSHNGKDGTCDLHCATPQVPKFCCHMKGEDYFHVYLCCEEIVDFAVVGGLKTEPNEFPYVVALGWYSEEIIYEYNFRCGGALISPKFAVTAAHCAYVNGLEPNVVSPGGYNFRLQVAVPVWTIDEVTVHPEYDEEFSYHDIALLRLFGEYPGQILDLWRRPNIVNGTFTALGYGDTSFDGTSSDALLKVFLEFVPKSKCAAYYDDEDMLPIGLLNTQICAKDPSNMMDTCQGDSGGPLIMTTYSKNGTEKQEYLVGITSFGQGCATSPPGVYTRVFCYLPWMDEVMRPYRNDSFIPDKTWNWHKHFFF